MTSGLEPGDVAVASAVPAAVLEPPAQPPPPQPQPPQPPPASGSVAELGSDAGLGPAAAPEPDDDDDTAARLAYLAFALAGRLADVSATLIRTRVADGQLDEARQVLRAALTESDIELTQTEALAVRACLPADALNEQLRIVDSPRQPGYRFSPAPDGPAPRLLEAASSVRTWVDGLAGLWFTLRTTDTQSAAPVWLGEARIGSDLIEITAEIQHRLAELGEVPPRVEIFTPETELTQYHRDALARAELVWIDPELPELRLARTFDGADPNTGPYFAADHARLDGPDRQRMLQYLSSADVVMSGGSMPDVLAPEQGPAVPMAFRCDGVWIWTEPVIYYLERYGLVPEAGLTQHLLRVTTLPQPCSPLTRARALAAITSPESGAKSVGRQA